MIDILQGINYIHNKNIIHCDLTLNNILIDNNNSIKITDFGLAKNISDYQSIISSSEYGTYIYTAPETIKQKKCSVKSDIYSLGIIWFELLHNFETEMERIEMIKKIKKNKITCLNYEIISKMLNKKSEN